MKVICKVAFFAGVALMLNSCGLYYSLTGYNKGFGDAGGYYAGHYDDAGTPIYGHEKGLPVYGYTPAGLPVHALNQLYAGCYVPNWGAVSSLYPQGVRLSSNPPRMLDSSNSGNPVPHNGNNY